MVNDEQVRAFFRKKATKPLHFNEIVSLMGLVREERKPLKRILRNLTAEGELVRTRKGFYGPAQAMELVTGYFEAHREGYGFVIAERPGQRDVFVPLPAVGSAMDNDKVVVRVEDHKRRAGRIIRVLERAHARIAGVAEVSRGACFVRPKEKSIPFGVVVPPRDCRGVKDGQTVVVEIRRYPEGRRPATGRVVKVLARPDTPRAEVEAVIEEFGLPRRFPTAVRTEAKTLYEKEPGLGRRKDLTGLPTVTIDGERARDFDDAVSVRRGSDGYTLWVHIADVGYYVPWDSIIDLEARKRGTSVYFPDRVLPMLPRELSEDLCSLRPRVQRPAMTVEMGFDREGEPAGTRFYSSVIRSDERMTYTSVRKILTDGDPGERARYGHLLGDFELMAELAALLRARRLARGSLDFDLPEPEVVLDLQGRPEAVLKAERNLAHMLIEDFMIAANEAVARHLEGLGVPSLYRIHEEPEAEKVQALTRFARLPLTRGKRPGPGRVAEILDAARGTPTEEIVVYAILRSLKQARYSAENVGHFGLASECYTHFTSPIRRYPDLVVHRVLKEVLSRKHMSDRRTEALASLLPDIAFQSSRRERVADDAERDVVQAMRMWFMRDKVGEEFEGHVVGVTPYGMRVRLQEFYVEGFIHVSFLTDDYYQYDERSMALRGRHTSRGFKPGQEVRVRVERVDIEERELVLGLV
ncbi:MAG: ribonuclease R [Nitrospirota bacterium]